MPDTRGKIVPYRQMAALQPYDPRLDDRLALRASVRGPLRAGLLIIGGFVIGFGIWAAVVPLSSGAVAPGIISPDGSRRTVQHLEGGIVRTLHVRDGDVVEAGQPLLELESVQAKSNYDLLQKHQRTLRITSARLEAERVGAEQIEFPADLLESRADIMAVMAAQRELFRTRHASYETRNRILRRRIAQLREQIKGFGSQVDSAARQIELIDDELAGKRVLAQKGYLPKPELLRVMRVEAELDGRLGQYKAAIAEAEQQIGEAELQLEANEAGRADQIATQLDQVQAELNAIEEKLIASKDILKRTVVTAPINGIVVNLKFKTESGVIQPGAPILDIVPGDERLLIDARISPMDIDVVQAGLTAQVQLTVFSSRSAPRIDGVVRTVSADRLVDETTHQAYYLARVEVDRDELHRLDSNIELVPGMPADVLIVTGQRTMASYLLRPFLAAIWKTLREV